MILPVGNSVGARLLSLLRAFLGKSVADRVATTATVILASCKLKYARCLGIWVS